VAGAYAARSLRTGKLTGSRPLPPIEAVTRYVTDAAYFGGDARHADATRIPVSVARVRFLED
jgi:hypothetical protein